MKKAIGILLLLLALLFIWAAMAFRHGMAHATLVCGISLALTACIGGAIVLLTDRS